MLLFFSILQDSFVSFFIYFLFGSGLGGGLSGLVLQVFGWFGLASTKFDMQMHGCNWVWLPLTGLADVWL